MTSGSVQNITGLIQRDVGLILVDRPLDGQYTYNRKRGDPLQLIHLASCPFLGGYEDFLDSPSLFDSYSPQLEQPFRLGLLDDLLLYWSKVNPAPFIGEHLNLIAVAHYPLRIVAAEWIIYVAVMYRAIKQYEYTTAVEGKIHQELEKLDADMRALQRWRRRSLSTGQKIKAIITVLHAYEKTDSNMIASLLQDYEYLSDAIETFGERLESMLPFVASLVQIVDSRRSFSETANISRLTIVALVFVPLAYVSSLFSMTGELGLGGSLFWLYFAVAIPVTTTVFLIVRPPLKLYRRMGRSARSVRFPRVQAMRFWERLTGSKTGL